MSQSTAASHSGNATTPRHSGKCGAFIRNPRAPFVTLVAALFLSIALPAQAATITVDTTDDVVADDGQCSLREAVLSANDSASTHPNCPDGEAGADIIVFDPALAGGTITLNGIEMQILEPLTITGPVADDPAGITIDGNQASRIFNILSSSSSPFTVVLNNLTLTDGKTTADFLDGSGGAVHARDASLELNHVVVSGSSTEGQDADGGGLFVFGGDAFLTDSLVTKNSTTGFPAEGGGLYVSGNLQLIRSTVSENSTEAANARGGGAFVSSGNALLIDSSILNNSTKGEGAFGGGLAVRLGNIDLNGSTVSDNSTEGDEAPGGGLYVKEGSALLLNSAVTNNSTAGDDGDGGGIHVLDGNADLTNSTVSGNSTDGDFAEGGGLYINNGDATIVRSMVSDNSTAGSQGHGGGVRVSIGAAMLEASTVSGNSTAGELAAGGGLSVVGDATLINSTVSGNRADNGGPGGLHATDNASLTHSTIAFNTAGSGTTDGVFISLNFDLTNSLIVQAGNDEVACNKVATGGMANVVTDSSCGDAPGNVTVASLPDINLAPLAFNGGPTQTHALLNPSVAIDAASEVGCNNLSPIEDQRGVPRSASAIDCDVGAYEFASAGVFLFAQPLFTEHEDSGPAVITVTRSDGSFGAASVDVSIIDDTATFPDDYLNAGPEMLTWADGENGPMSFTIELVDDGIEEDDSEFVTLRLENEMGAILTSANRAQLAILDPLPKVMFNDALSPVIPEDAGTFTIPGAILLSRPSDMDVTVDLEVDPASIATSPGDFTIPAQVTIPAGEISADLEVTVVDDAEVEGDELALVNLVNPVNATLGDPAAGEAVIEDNDSSSGAGGTAKDDDDDDDGGFPGCTMGPVAGPLDPLLPLVVLLAAAYLVRRLR